ncbi:MAG: tripartite tricarboxylate transporter substrate binding protein [Betaproteobacteria bacterium]|nr:tripartite tricarboxylate transporter substrate binding protein [Betaproteobacteria bacterium]
MIETNAALSEPAIPGESHGRPCTRAAGGEDPQGTPRTIVKGRSGIRLGVALLISLAVAPAVSWAQAAYPSRVIKIVVPFPGGTTADEIPRLVAEKLSARWGQQVIIENRPGATGNIGAGIVAKAEPDGYTLLSTAPPPLVVNHNLYSNLGFDPTAFVPISLMAVVPNVLIGRKELPANSLGELIALSKDKPGQFTSGTTGPGGTPRLSMEMLQLVSGMKLRDIPYRGGTAPVLVDVLGGRIDTMFINISDALAHIRSGSVKALGVATEKRVPQLPDVPAIAESFPGYYAATWYAMMAPPKTPPQITAKVSAAVMDILKTTDVGTKLQTQSMIVVAASQAETAKFLKDEIERWRGVIKAAGLKAE